MSTKSNPGSFNCYDRAEPDEPLFTLLGRDPAASFAVALWVRVRTMMFGGSEQVAEAAGCSEQMRDWALRLGKGEALKSAYDAFRAACVEVARGEIQAEASELFKLVSLYGIKCDRPEVKTRVLDIAKKLSGVE